MVVEDLILILHEAQERRYRSIHHIYRTTLDCPRKIWKNVLKIMIERNENIDKYNDLHYRFSKQITRLSTYRYSLEP